MAKSTTPLPVLPTKEVAPTDNTVLSMAKRLTVLSEARTSLANAQEALIQRFGRLNKDVACPQDALQAFLLLKQIKDDAEKACEAIKAAFIAHKDAKGEFEHGKFAITIKYIAKTTVAWKEVSVDLGRKLAQAAGQQFNADNFEDGIKQLYGKSGGQTNLSVIESA